MFFYNKHISDVSLTAQGASTRDIWPLSSQRCVGDQRCECAAGTPGSVLFSGPAAKARPVMGL